MRLFGLAFHLFLFLFFIQSKDNRMYTMSNDVQFSKKEGLFQGFSIGTKILANLRPLSKIGPILKPHKIPSLYFEICTWWLVAYTLLYLTLI